MNEGAPEPIDVAAVQARWKRYRADLGDVLDLRLDEIAPGRARLRMPWSGTVGNPYGIVHGGALATLCDVSAYVALLTRFGADARLVTTGMHVDFLAAARAPYDVFAEAEVLRSGRRLGTAVVRLTAEGRLVAHATLSFARTEEPKPT